MVLLAAARPLPRDAARRRAKRDARRDPLTLWEQGANARGVIAVRMARLALWRDAPPVPDRAGQRLQMRLILAAIRRDRLSLTPLP